MIINRTTFDLVYFFSLSFRFPKRKALGLISKEDFRFVQLCSFPLHLNLPLINNEQNEKEFFYPCPSFKSRFVSLIKHDC